MAKMTYGSKSTKIIIYFTNAIECEPEEEKQTNNERAMSPHTECKWL